MKVVPVTIGALAPTNDTLAFFRRGPLGAGLSPSSRSAL